MGVRIMERAREPLYHAVLVTLIPALRGRPLSSPWWLFTLDRLGLLLYILNVVVIAVAGKILSRYMPTSRRV